MLYLHTHINYATQSLSPVVTPPLSTKQKGHHTHLHLSDISLLYQLKSDPIPMYSHKHYQILCSCSLCKTLWKTGSLALSKKQNKQTKNKNSKAVNVKKGIESNLMAHVHG